MPMTITLETPLSLDMLRTLNTTFYRLDAIRPQTLATATGMDIGKAAEILKWLRDGCYMTTRYLVYHNCADTPICRVGKPDALNDAPFVCPECGELILIPEMLRREPYFMPVDDFSFQNP